MNLTLTIAVACAALATISTAGAQAPAPAEAKATGAASAPAPTASPPRLDMKPPARPPREAPVSADARGCLEFPSNLEVIKCAEKYLHRRAG
jgi:hypothetical protein